VESKSQNQKVNRELEFHQRPNGRQASNDQRHYIASGKKEKEAADCDYSK